MGDIEIVAAWPLDCKTLRVACPFCEHDHYHTVRAVPYPDIREANCRQRDLPKRLRGKVLRYRLRLKRMDNGSPRRSSPSSARISKA